jgi:hypothetical protein
MLAFVATDVLAIARGRECGVSELPLHVKEKIRRRRK